jgi:glycosyltransferase involved in cell wall biosynthesis
VSLSCFEHFVYFVVVSRGAVPMISFVVPAYNEELLVGEAVRSIHAAARAIGEPYEIIVANDGSDDRTAAVAEEGGARVVTAVHRQIAATRNSGARAAVGDVFIFVDADTIVNEAVVRGAVRELRAGAVGGGAGVVFDGPVPRWARIMLPLLVRLFRARRLACGCFVFCSRAAYEAVGGFDERFYGAEELVISQALKRRGRFVVMREAVTTSGRKVRAYSGWEMLATLGRFALRGRRSVQQRDGMEIWYGARRDDPGA